MIRFWGPVRALLRKFPERETLLALSVVTGVLCGGAAVLLKWGIHSIQHGLDTLSRGMRWP